MFIGPHLELLIPITAIICTFLFLMRVTSLKQANARFKHEAEHGKELEELRVQVESFGRVIQRLEARIRVLERIATDDSTKLRDEIERLRA